MHLRQICSILFEIHQVVSVNKLSFFSLKSIFMSSEANQSTEKRNLQEEPLHKNFRIAIILIALIPLFLATCLSYILIFDPDRYSSDIFRDEVLLAAVLWVPVIILPFIGTRPPNPKPPVPTEDSGGAK